MVHMPQTFLGTVFRRDGSYRSFSSREEACDSPELRRCDGELKPVSPGQCSHNPPWLPSETVGQSFRHRVGPLSCSPVLRMCMSQQDIL